MRFKLRACAGLGLLGLASQSLSVLSCSGQRDNSVGQTRGDHERDSTEKNDAAPTDAVSEGSTATSEGSSESSTLTSDANPSPTDVCPALSLSFESLPPVGEGTLTIDAVVASAPIRVTVEVLQSPETAEQWNWQTDSQVLLPEDWDRSEIPAGACVIRLLDMGGGCYRTAGASLLTFLTPTTDGKPKAIGWTRYDEYVQEQPELCSYAPGCPSPELNAPWQWFYLRESGPDLYFVWCSQTCPVPDAPTVLGLSSSTFDPCDK